MNRPPGRLIQTCCKMLKIILNCREILDKNSHNKINFQTNVL